MLTVAFLFAVRNILKLNDSKGGYNGKGFYQDTVAGKGDATAMV